MTLSGAALLVVPQVAASAGAGACPGTSGVTVVVDFGSLGGGVQVRCAPGDPEDGLDALGRAGFSYSYVPRVPGMVCQIEALPDPCNGAPTDAYWAYSYAEAGGSWTYSQYGGGSHDPEPGDVEGWAFGAGRSPSIAPPSPPPTTTPPTTSPPPPTAVTASPGAAPSPGPTGGAPGNGPGEASTPEAPVEGTMPGAPAVDETTNGSGETAPAEGRQDRSSEDGEASDRTEVAVGASGSRDRDGSGGGGAAGTAAGLAVVAAVGAGGALVARRRRAASVAVPEAS